MRGPMRRTLLLALIALFLSAAPAAAQDDWTAPVIEPVVTGPEGENGWYRGDVTVAWRISEPESRATLTTTGCAESKVLADTARAHFRCVATSAGGTTTHGWIVKRDTAPPAIACEAPRRWTQGSSRTLYVGSATDELSGLLQRRPSAFIDTRALGPVSVTLTARDRAGNSATQVCTIVVERSGPVPREECARTTVQVLDVRHEGARVVVSGIARAGLAGDEVSVAAVLPGRGVLGGSVTTTVGADGAFEASLPLPARRHRAQVVYEASAEGKRSALALRRRVVVTSRIDSPEGVVVTGRVRGVHRPRTVRVLRRVGCAASTAFARVRTSRSGAFTVTLPRAAAPAHLVTYRFSARRRGGASASAPVVVGR
jgi:hypothetical protein